MRCFFVDHETGQLATAIGKLRQCDSLKQLGKLEDFLSGEGRSFDVGFFHLSYVQDDPRYRCSTSDSSRSLLELKRNVPGQLWLAYSGLHETKKPKQFMADDMIATTDLASVYGELRRLGDMTVEAFLSRLGVRRKEPRGPND